MGQIKESVDAYQKAFPLPVKPGIGLEARALNNLGDTYLIAREHPQGQSLRPLAISQVRKNQAAPRWLCRCRSNRALP